MVNKKVKNATITQYKDITFKSKLESMVYKTLVDNGIEVEYEPSTIEVFGSFQPITPFYTKETNLQYHKRLKEDRSPKKLTLNMHKQKAITYCPDFYFRYNNIDVWVEAKGAINDVYPYKKKLFRAYLDNKYYSKGIKSMYFEVYSKAQVLQMINILKNGEES